MVRAPEIVKTGSSIIEILEKTLITRCTNSVHYHTNRDRKSTKLIK